MCSFVRMNMHMHMPVWQPCVKIMQVASEEGVKQTPQGSTLPGRLT
jgi:hypothetical protein